MYEPDKSLEQILELVRKNIVKAYQLLQTQDASGLSKIVSELSLQNFSLSYYAADYELLSKTLEAEYTRQRSQTFMQEREAGATEKNADAKAKIKWHDMYMQYLDANKMYRLSKATHKDVENMMDVVRSRISLLKMEMTNLREG